MKSNMGIYCILYIQVFIPQIPPEHNRGKKEHLSGRILTSISSVSLYKTKRQNLYSLLTHATHAVKQLTATIACNTVSTYTYMFLN